MNRARLLAIMRGDDRSLSGTLTRAGLALIAPGYRIAMALRNGAYSRGLKKSHRLARPVISVGNLTTGGTGKTPMVIELARRLQQMGHTPAVLLRGYMRDGHQQSDEADELRAALGERVPVVANHDRVAASQQALTQRDDVDIFLLDDGFQHRKVQRDLDLVLLDATAPWGYGHLLPRGLLREPRHALRRASAVIVTRVDQISDVQRKYLDEQVQDITGSAPIAHAAHEWLSLLENNDQEHLLDSLRGQRVVLALAIGNPAAFERMARANGAIVTGSHVFPDHHAYTSDDVHALVRDAQRADAILTSEKDWTKLHAHLTRATNLRAYRPKLKMTLLDGSDAVDTLLRNVLTVKDQVRS